MNTASAQLLTYVSGLGPQLAAQHRGLPQRAAARFARARELLGGAAARAQGLRAGGGLPAHPRRRQPAGRQRRAPRELPASWTPWPPTWAARCRT
ncbi:MAG: helix-hairpin-helix domain-containing protein [Desulfobacterales bacterium]|nr:helix-hairpin-helix domain-containing protein [Desulfobacterales bacterium]